MSNYYNKEDYEYHKRISKMENIKTGDYLFAIRYCHDYESLQEYIKESIKEAIKDYQKQNK